MSDKHTALRPYEEGLTPAREMLNQTRGLRAVMAPDVSPEFLELFLIEFCARGVGMTEPVDGWIRRAGERCVELGIQALGEALVSHAEHEAGHHLMMVEDTKKLVSGWNARNAWKLDAAHLLARPPSPGVRRYQELHERCIRGPAPYGQLAIEYEIEMLSVTHGAALMKHCVERLGHSVMGSLSFIEEHVLVDVGHTKFNALQLNRLLTANPQFLGPLVEAGSGALGAYAEFIDDCHWQADAHYRAARAGA